MGHFKGDRKTSQALDTFVKLMRAANSVSAATHARSTDAGLTVSQFAVLEVLYHAGPLCLTEIAHKILTTAGNLTLVVNNLEKRGLVRRRQNPEDKRFYSLHLTGKGRALITGVFPQQAAEIARVLSALSMLEQVELARLCKKLGMAAAHGSGRKEEDGRG
jgi:MarR family transcriptional regulator, 2-MHQ and catechol-resistance regulon repressor